MSDFNRAYRDPKSPLQPLTPLSVNHNFSFNIGGDGGLKPWIDQFDIKRGKRQLKSFFSPQPQPQQKQQPCGTPNICVIRSPAASGCQFGAENASRLPITSPMPIKKNGLFSFKSPQIVVPRGQHSSNVEPSQKLVEVLKRVGMLKYWSLFKLNGINFDTFQRLTCRDFEELGIDKPKHLNLLLQGVELARSM
ncbi:uncharacterized protein [Eurosta solidaginis]|uniref:uncharacterized protein n=1 Tax=Eurosta solidaginis TaxID=178769 RepID=UPI0035315E4E